MFMVTIPVAYWLILCNLTKTVGTKLSRTERDALSEVKGEEAEGPGRTWISVEEAQKEGMKIDHEREASIIGNLQETAL